MGFDPEKITFFAKTDARGHQVPFGIKARDRQRHMYVVGKTGMGKSTLLENMAAQDIKNGEGMAFIDPHGSAAETLLEYIPENRVDDVIYFAPFDLNNPISFNVMEDVGPDKRHLVVSGLMSTFKKIWVDAWSARMEYILTNALLALIEYPDTTLLSVNRLFTDKNYRNLVVDYIKDPAVKAFWTDEFAGYTERFIAEALPAIQNKIGQFTGNPLIRNIIGQPHSSFDLRKVMDEKKILIINLSKGLIGETNANLLGSMLTTRIYLAAMSRADLSVDEMKQMPNFYFYVDEFQSFANATFANILSEARKYHLNLIIAHQYIEQMEEEVKNAVFGNVGTTVSFRVGPFDAEVLETVFAPQFEASDLVNLGFAQIYLTLMIDGIGSQPFSAITLPPIERPRVSFKTMAITNSRRNFTKKREEVEKVVIELHMPARVENKSENKNQNQNQNQNQRKNNNQTKTPNQNQNFDNKFKKDNFKVNEENNLEKKNGLEELNLKRKSFFEDKNDEKIIFSKDLETNSLDFKNQNRENKSKEKTGKSLAELRDVLAKITAEEKEENQNQEIREEVKGKAEEKKINSKDELRNLLAGFKKSEKTEVKEGVEKSEKIETNKELEIKDEKEKKISSESRKLEGEEKKVISQVNIEESPFKNVVSFRDFDISKIDFSPQKTLANLQLEKEREKVREEEREKIRQEVLEEERKKIELRKQEVEKKRLEQEVREKARLEMESKRQKEREEMEILSDEIDSFFLELERWGGAKKVFSPESVREEKADTNLGSSFSNQKNLASGKKNVNFNSNNNQKSNQNQNQNFGKNNQKFKRRNYQNFSNQEIKKRLIKPRGEKSPFVPQ